MYGVNLGLRRARTNRQGTAVTLDFRASVLPVGSVFTRASAATDVINGVLTSFASGAARISLANGYLAETARTNSLRNGNATGATAGVLGSGGALPTNWNDVNTVGLTRTIMGSGTVNGFPYIDLQLSGTPTAGTYSLLMEAVNQITAASGQTWTGSFWIGLMAGSMTGITSVGARISGRASGGTESEGTTQTIVPTIDPARVSAIRALNGGTTNNAVVQMDAIVTAVPINATLRIAACQLEQGYGATSYIPTTTVAVPRSADVLYIPTSSIAGYNNVGTLVFKGKTAKFLDPAVSQYLGALTNNPSASDEHRFFKDPFNFSYTHYQGLVSYGGAAFADINKAPNTGLGQNIIAAGSWNTGASNVKVNVNGGTPSTATITSLPNNCNRLYIGSTSTGLSQWHGYIESIDYYSYARADI